MLGLKNLPLNKLTTAFMVISAAMMIFAVAGGAGASFSTATLLVWIVCALVLLGVWIAVAVEVFKRFFGGQSPSAGGTRARTGREERG